MQSGSGRRTLTGASGPERGRLVCVHKRVSGPAPGLLLLGVQFVLVQAGEGAEVDHWDTVASRRAQAVSRHQPFRAVGISYVLRRTRTKLVEPK